MTPAGERETHVDGDLYLLHFVTPSGDTTQVSHAGHYLGWASKGRLFARLAEHEKGNGGSPPLIRALREQGDTFEVTRVWRDETRFEERRLKGSSVARLCPHPDCQRARQERRAMKKAGALVASAGEE